jgi:hypothetical protein
MQARLLMAGALAVAATGGSVLVSRVQAAQVSPLPAQVTAKQSLDAPETNDVPDTVANPKEKAGLPDTTDASGTDTEAND